MYLLYLLSVKKDPKHTVSVEFSSKTMQVGDKDVKLQLWDTAGQERYRSVTKSYYKGAVGVLIVYDITKYLLYLIFELIHLDIFRIGLVMRLMQLRKIVQCVL